MMVKGRFGVLGWTEVTVGELVLLYEAAPAGRSLVGAGG